MTATNHALTGVVIGLALQKPLLALPLAFASHFVLDATPHFGYKDTIDFGTHLNHRLSKYLAVLDLALLFLLVGVLLHYSVDPWVYLTALVALVPDFEWLVAYYGFERRGKKPPRSPFAKMHAKIQWMERPWGAVVEVGWFLIGVAVVVNFLR